MNTSIIVRVLLLLTLLALPTAANATLTFDVSTVTTDGALSINGVASSAYTIGAATTTGTITIGGTAQTGNLVMGQSSGTNTILIGSGTGATTIALATGSTSSRVGIGTTSPASYLHIVGTTEQLRLGYNNTNYVKLTVGSAAGITLTPSSNSATAFNFTKADGTSSVLNIDTSNAYVGIGTATPGANLHVVGTAQFQAGSGTANYAPSGVLTVNTTSAQTAADTTETTLWTYTLPANTLNTNGKILRITVFGNYGSNNNCKTLRLYFGSAQIDGTGDRCGNTSGNGWEVVGHVIRSGSNTQIATSKDFYSSTSVHTSPTTAATETDSGPITISFSAQNSTASAGDVVFKGAFVELLP